MALHRLIVLSIWKQQNPEISVIHVCIHTVARVEHTDCDTDLFRCCLCNQAGILQGQVDDLMVLDQWQASLMRALAQLQLNSDAAVRQHVAEQFDIGEGDAGLD